MSMRARRFAVRSAVLLLMAALLQAAVLPGRATAAPAPIAAGTIVVDGPPVTVTLASHQKTDLTFQWNGTARVRLKFTNCSNMFFNLIWGEGYSRGLGCAGPPAVPWGADFDPGTPRAIGPVRIEFEADRNNDGIGGFVTIELDSVPPTHTGGLVVAGTALNLTFASRTDEAWITFDGVAGQNLNLLTTSSTTAGCWAFVSIRKPDGTMLPNSGCHTGSISHALGRLTQTGRYRIEVDRFSPEPAGGTMSLRLIHAAAPLPAACMTGRVKPIALVHGFGGSPADFDDMRPFLLERLRAEFGQAGATAAEAATCAPTFLWALAVGPQASSAANASVIQQRLTEIANFTGVTPIDIIAHSKGGLDSRTAIERSPLVRNLVMIATPNGGTLIADVGCGAYNLSLGNPITDPVGYAKRLAARTALRRIVERFGRCRGSQDALWGLTRDFVQNDLNPSVQDNPNVLYQTIAGDSPCILCRAYSVFVGPNDGLVPVSSVEYLAGRGHISAGQFPDTHSGLLTSGDVADRAYCSLVPRGRDYGPCDVVPGDVSGAEAAADNPQALLHFEAVTVPAGGSATVTLPIGGRGPVNVAVLTDQAALTGSAGGTALGAESHPIGRALGGTVQSASNQPLVLTNPGSQPADALVMVFGTATAGLAVQVTPPVAAPNQARQIRVVNASPAGLVGSVTAPDGTETPLTFTASGSDAVATHTPTVTGDHAVSVTHEGATQRLAFARLPVGAGGATLPGTYTAGLATGPDGLADALNLDVNVTVAQAGEYTLSGGLATADGTLLGTAEVTGTLAAGARQLRLSFRGAVLYAAARNGPYHLVDVTLARTGVIEARVPATAPTTAYAYTAFRPALVVPAAATVVEGDTGTKTVEFPVTLSERVNVPVTAEFVSTNQPGSATWPEDYDVVWSRLTFLPGETAKTVSLTIRGDRLDENDEMALVHFYSATNAKVGGFGGVGGVSIVDDDAVPVIQPGFAPSIVEGDAGTAVVQVPVTLSAPSGRPVTVRYAPFTQAGYAVFPGDFEAPTGTLTFQPGETSKTIALTVKGDTVDEADEGALIAFTEPTNATVGGFGVAGVTIVDDDP